MPEGRVRCPWAGDDPLYVAYHDAEWGVPLHGDARLFELLTLEGAQAGLSWLTVLRRRDGYRRAFEGFDPARVARFGPARIAALLRDPGVIRHRGKLESAVSNARALLALRAAHGSFDAFVWRFVEGRPVVNRRRRLSEVPTETPASRALSRALRAAGFTFVGPTICQAFMQAAGLVNDHLVGCFRHPGAGRRRGAAGSRTAVGGIRGAGLRVV